jgi:hypothetical protein
MVQTVFGYCSNLDIGYYLEFNNWNLEFSMSGDCIRPFYYFITDYGGDS